MMNPNEIPSLSACLDRYIEDVEVVPGKVENADYRLFHTFSIDSEEVAGMTAQELFLLYLKPVIENYFAPALKKLGQVCTKALPLPGKGEAVIGFRCWQGKIPVNLYICRRPNPDRHQYILDAVVYPVGEEDGEA
jgi:hypothetical protein